MHYNLGITSGMVLTCEYCGCKTNNLINGLCNYCFKGSSLRGNLYGNNKQPYMCPICRGTGKVPRGYYCRSLSDTFVSCGGEEECHSCKGTGVIWG